MIDGIIGKILEMGFEVGSLRQGMLEYKH